MRPIQRVRDVAVLDRIVVGVIHMPAEVGGIPDGMLPEPPLPQSVASTVPWLERRPARNHRAGEHRLDAAPTEREISIAIGQREDCVEVVRQDDDRVDLERAFSPHRAESPAQRVDRRREQRRSTISKCHGKEERSTRDEIAAVTYHDPRPPTFVVPLSVLGSPYSRRECGIPAFVVPHEQALIRATIAVNLSARGMGQMRPGCEPMGVFL